MHIDLALELLRNSLISMYKTTPVVREGRARNPRRDTFSIFTLRVKLEIRNQNCTALSAPLPTFFRRILFDLMKKYLNRHNF